MGSKKNQKTLSERHRGRRANNVGERLQEGDGKERWKASSDDGLPNRTCERGQERGAEALGLRSGNGSGPVESGMGLGWWALGPAK